MMEIYNNVISRYLKMGAEQFLKDFCRDYHKKIISSLTILDAEKRKSGKSQMKVNFALIERDRYDTLYHGIKLN